MIAGIRATHALELARLNSWVNPWVPSQNVGPQHGVLLVIFCFYKKQTVVFRVLFLFFKPAEAFLFKASKSFKSNEASGSRFFFLSSPAPLEVVSILHGLLRLRGLGPAVPLRKAGALDRSRRRSPEIPKRGRHGKKGRGLFREFGLRL